MVFTIGVKGLSSEEQLVRVYASTTSRRAANKTRRFNNVVANDLIIRSGTRASISGSATAVPSSIVNGPPCWFSRLTVDAVVTSHLLRGTKADFRGSACPAAKLVRSSSALTAIVSFSNKATRNSITTDQRISKLYEIPDRGTTRGALYARIGARAQPTGKTRGRLDLPRG